jgi:tRNA A58 N-methylase Trm61
VKEDFGRNGVSSVVTVKVRDIQGECFPAELAGCVDGAFLDLPQPWLAIPSVVRSLRCDGLVCSITAQASIVVRNRNLARTLLSLPLISANEHRCPQVKLMRRANRRRVKAMHLLQETLTIRL